MVLKGHKSNTAFREAKMLALYIFLVSCCLSGSMGSAIEEFQANFKALVDLASEETFLPVPCRKFQCNRVPCQLERTVEWLKRHCRNDEMRTYISRMEKNKDHIISALKKARTKPERDGSCPMTEVPPRSALRRYTKFFENLHERC